MAASRPRKEVSTLRTATAAAGSVRVPALRGDVWLADNLDRAATVGACKRDPKGTWGKTTLAEGIALVAHSSRASDVDYASARVEKGLHGSQFVRFDLRPGAERR